jgi:hypothetical protein
MGGSDIGLLSVISGFLPAYYRFWDESASWGARHRCLPPLDVLERASRKF